MSKAAKTVLVFGIYLALLGVTLLVVPNLLLTLFGFPTTGEPWIRVVGLLVLIIAYFYVQAAHSELRPFFQWTLHSRPPGLVCFIALVAFGLAKPTLILFGVIELLGAIWTGLALRSSES